MDTGERVEDAYDKGHQQGHRCGYMDAVSEIWLYVNDIRPDDPRHSTIVGLATFLNERREQVLRHADETLRAASS